MVTEWQFAAVAAYLLWCLFSSVTGMFESDQDNAEQTPEINESDRNEETVTSG